jgi:RimJ/RimL family protein N-acetyltransferase
MRKMVRYCAARGTKTLAAHIMRENKAMLRLAADIGFHAEATGDGDIVDLSIVLNPASSKIMFISRLWDDSLLRYELNEAVGGSSQSKRSWRGLRCLDSAANC